MIYPPFTSAALVVPYRNWASDKMRPTQFGDRKNTPGYDNCTVCHGTRGGVRGNENVVDGVVMCDYCHAEFISKQEVEKLKIKGAETGRIDSSKENQANTPKGERILVIGGDDGVSKAVAGSLSRSLPASLGAGRVEVQELSDTE